jgi:hypothetical protein
MRSFLNSFFILLLAGGLAAAQTTTQPAPAKDSTGNLPTEATVDSFLHQQFGYQSDLTWKISGIRPSQVPDLAEVTVVLASPQGQQLTKF